jgi:hypothetical protein
MARAWNLGDLDRLPGGLDRDRGRGVFPPPRLLADMAGPFYSPAGSLLMRLNDASGCDPVLERTLVLA